MNTPPADGHIIPYRPHRRSRRLSIAVDSWVTVTVCVLFALGGVLVGSGQRDQQKAVVLECHYPAPLVAASDRPVALLCKGVTR